MKSPSILNNLFALGLAASFSLTACQTQVSPTGIANQNVSTQTGDNSVGINNNSKELQKRVALKNEPIEITKDAFSTQQVTTPLSLRLVAEVAPPIVNGRKVQATNVHLEGDLAYVSYDIAGDGFSGGVYILDISSPSEPKLLAEMTLGDTDFYSLTKNGNRLFLSGASLRNNLNSRAVMQVLELASNGKSFDKDLGLVDLPSFAATDVSVKNNAIYVTTGALNGGVAKVDASALTTSAFYAFEDARTVSTDYQDKITVFRGTTGELQVLDQNLKLEQRLTLSDTATIPFSKSTVDIRDNIAVVGSGDGGVLSVDLAQNLLLSKIKAKSGLTNGASVDEDLVFMAEGSDGVSVAQISEAGTMERLGTLNFETNASSNMVVHRDNVVFVANGQGGLSILTVDREEPETLPGQADIVFIFDGGNSPSGQTQAQHESLFALIDNLEGADVTFAVASTATKHTKHPHNDDKDATKLLVDATTNVSEIKDAISSYPHIGGTSMDTYSALVETAADPTVGDQESDGVTRRKNAAEKNIPLVQIIVTDHQPEQLRGKFVNFSKPDAPEREAAVAEFLTEANTRVFVLCLPEYFDVYDSITEATGGSLINVQQDYLKNEIQALTEKIRQLK